MPKSFSGERFPRQIPYRLTPTDRQKVISERLAEMVKDETGVVVDPETARAVRWTMNRMPGLQIFDSPDELEILTRHAKFNRKREHALKLLNEAARELDRYMNDDYEDDDDD